MNVSLGAIERRSLDPEIRMPDSKKSLGQELPDEEVADG